MSILKKRSKVAKLYWSKKEKDWVADKGFMHCLIQQFDELMKADWEGKPTGYTNFREYLKNCGYDPDTFRITVKPSK